MFAKSLALTAALTLAACATGSESLSSAADQQGRDELTARCKGRDGWSDVAPPARVFGNVYMVGTCGISVLLITSPRGHILIDGATEKAVPSILDNIRKLGFKPTDVKYILNGHAHDDHAGGLAALKQATGAKMVARAAARAALESGKVDESDPQNGITSAFHGLKVDRLIADGGQLKLGPLKLTATATPGHTLGSTSWSWQSCERKTCHSMVFADSLSAISADGYRFTDHPEYVAIFRATYDRVAKLPNCDILMTPHPSASDLFERLSGAESLVDGSNCQLYAAGAAKNLDARLKKEAGQ